MTARYRARRPTATANVDDRIEDLLEKGNQFRDARRFAEAEDAYQSILKTQAARPDARPTASAIFIPISNVGKKRNLLIAMPRRGARQMSMCWSR